MFSRSLWSVAVSQSVKNILLDATSILSFLFLLSQGTTRDDGIQGWQELFVQTSLELVTCANKHWIDRRICGVSRGGNCDRAPMFEWNACRKKAAAVSTLAKLLIQATDCGILFKVLSLAPAVRIEELSASRCTAPSFWYSTRRNDARRHRYRPDRKLPP